MTSLLSQIQSLLKKENYPYLHASPSENNPQERLIISLGVDQKKRELKVEVTEHSLPRLPKFETKTPEAFPSRIQFKLVLPFKVVNSSLNEISSLLHFLNQSIDIPGFELDELEGRVIYRYVWLTSPAHLDEVSVLTIFSGITLNLMLFSDNIESIAKGQTTFNDLLSDILNKFKQ